MATKTVRLWWEWVNDTIWWHTEEIDGLRFTDIPNELWEYYETTNDEWSIDEYIKLSSVRE